MIVLNARFDIMNETWELGNDLVLEHGAEARLQRRYTQGPYRQKSPDTLRKEVSFEFVALFNRIVSIVKISISESVPT